MLLICCNSKFNFGPQCDSQVGFCGGRKAGAKSLFVVYAFLFNNHSTRIITTRYLYQMLYILFLSSLLRLLSLVIRLLCKINLKLEGLKRSPDLLNNVKIGQG